MAEGQSDDLLARAVFILRANWPSYPGPSIAALVREIDLHLPCEHCKKRGGGGDCRRVKKGSA